MRLAFGIGVTIVASVVGATGAFGGSSSTASGAAAAKPTLAVVVVGGGRVTSAPAGISCPGKCAAAFAAGSRVLLTATPRSGSRFLRWGGNCTGARACRVRVSGLAAVAAQFVGSTAKPTPTPASAVVPGGYSGRGYGGRGLTFLVPAGAGSVLDFSSSPIPDVTCAGGGTYNTSAPPFTIPRATIRPDRSFTARVSQSAVVDRANATVTYSVTGRFQGTSTSGAPTAAGVYRVDIVFADTPNRKCTSNDQQWTAARSG